MVFFNYNLKKYYSFVYLNSNNLNKFFYFKNFNLKFKLKFLYKFYLYNNINFLKNKLKNLKKNI